MVKTVSVDSDSSLENSCGATGERAATRTVGAGAGAGGELLQLSVHVGTPFICHRDQVDTIPQHSTSHPRVAPASSGNLKMIMYM